MYLTMPWFIALVVFCFLACIAFLWAAIEIGSLHRHYEQVSYDVDRWRDTLNERLQRAEDWVKHLDERTRHQAGARLPEPVWHRPLVIDAVTTDDDTGPGTVPMNVPGPTTEPIPALPATQPQEAVLLAKLEDNGHDQWLADAMARIKAIAEGTR